MKKTKLIYLYDIWQIYSVITIFPELPKYYISSTIEVSILLQVNFKVQSNPVETQRLITIAERIAELGHPTRLMIFKYLVKFGLKGVPVGEIQQQLGIPSSTLSHHIAKMVKVGLIKQIRDSRTLFCVPQFNSLNEVVTFLQEECCINGCC